MDAEPLYNRTTSLADVEKWLALGDVGKENTRLKVGDRVVVPFTIACGRCYFCKEQLWSLCDNSNPNAWMAEKLYGYSASERGEIDPSFIITHRIGLEDAPAMYRTFRDKHDACIEVVMKPGGATPHHTNPPSSRQQ